MEEAISSCSVCLGGIIYHFNKGEFIGVFRAVFFMAFVEAFHMALNLMLSTPYEVVRDIMASVSIPMILANSMGMEIFAFMSRISHTSDAPARKRR